jgi:hypothetical protein
MKNFVKFICVNNFVAANKNPLTKIVNLSGDCKLGLILIALTSISRRIHWL